MVKYMLYIDKGKEYLDIAKDHLYKFHEWSDTKGYLPSDKIIKAINDHSVFGITSAGSLISFFVTGEFHPAYIVISTIGIGADAVKNKGIDVVEKQILKYLS